MPLKGKAKAKWQLKYMREYRQGKRRRPDGAHGKDQQPGCRDGEAK